MNVLVERDEEIGELTTLLASARAGRGGSAVVLAAAGLGKTALLRALGRQARDQGTQVCWTAAAELESQAPFGVVRRLLDRAVHTTSPSQRAALAEGPARLALMQLWGLGVTAGAGPSPSQGDMLHSVRWLLVELASRGPMLLTVDDAQWADPESLLLLGSMGDLLPELPVALVTAARDELSGRAPELSALIADRDAVLLRPSALSDSGIAVLLRSIWTEVASDAVSVVADATGGNPFLALALATTLADSEAPIDAERVRGAVPDSVIDLVVARLAALPAAEQALAGALAILDSAPLAVAAELADLDRATAAAAADRLRHAGLFADQVGLSFRHGLLRSAVLASVSLGRRDELHRTAARMSAAQSAPDALTQASAHLIASTGIGDGWAVDTLRTAAADALRRGAPQAAVTLLQRALAEPADATQVPAVLLELGQAQARMFDPTCATTLARAMELVTDPGQRVRHALALASAYSYGGFPALAAETLASTREAVGDVAPDLALTLEAAWASAGLLVPDLVPAVRSRLETWPNLPGVTAGERLVLIQQLTVAAGTNQPASTIRGYADRVIGEWDSPEQFPETPDWAWPRLMLAGIGEYDTVRRLTDAGLVSSAERGSLAGLVTASFVRGFTELHAGALVEAERHYRRMLAPDPTRRDPTSGLLAETLGCGGLAQSLALQGRTAEALDVLARFPGQLPEDAPGNGAAMLWFGRAVACRMSDDHEGALAAAQEAGRLGSRLGVDSPTWAAWRPLAIGPLRALGRTAEARELAVAHLELCLQGEVPHLIGEALCLSAGLIEDPAEAIDQARRGVAVLAATGSRYRLGTGSLTLGSLLRRTGARIEARGHLQDAFEVFTECGALSVAAFARSELAATGVHLTRAEQRRLTPSERRVAELAGMGLSNPQIAARLQVSRKTVESQLSAVYRKLDIGGRDELAAHVDQFGRTTSV